MKKFQIFMLIQNIISGLAHICDFNNGFIWFNYSNDCIKPWTTQCQDLYSDCQDCINKQSNGLNIAFPTTSDIELISNP